MIGQAVSAATTVHMNPRRIDVVVIEFLASVVVFTITSLLSQWMSTRLAQKGEYYDLYQLQSRTEQGLSIADARIKRRVTEAAE